MKLILIQLLLLLYVFGFAQIDEFSATDPDSISDPKIQKGIAFGGTPILSYDPDLGLRVGAVINLFDYGNGANFPKYLQYSKIIAYKSTKGTSKYSLRIDSKKLLPKSRIVVEGTHIHEIALDFFGFNGRNALVNADYTNHKSESFIQAYYYNHERKLTRFRFDIHHKISKKGWSLFSGIMYSDYRINDLNYDLLKNKPPQVRESLYSQYNQWGIIKSNEKSGGKLFNFSAGITFDTRNNKINSKEGTWFESYFMASPPKLSNAAYLKQITTLRQYFAWKSSNIVFSYRLSSQLKLAGEIPFYALPTFFDTRQNEYGLGGISTLRGISRNRIVANSFLLGNLEIRKKIIELTFLKLNWEVELSIFSDLAYITDEYRFSTSNVPVEKLKLYFSDAPQPLYNTFGTGVYFIYNTNNIISINYGISRNQQVANSGVYVGSTFLF